MVNRGLKVKLSIHLERIKVVNIKSINFEKYNNDKKKSEVKRLNLRYQEYGNKSAPLMMFLHGGGISDWMWDKQIQHFKHYHCLVPILPEHGLNHDETPFSIKGSAEALIPLVEEKAKGKEVILIGFSLGSQVIIQLLSMKPDLIDFAMINSALVRPISFAKKSFNLLLD